MSRPIPALILLFASALASGSVWAAGSDPKLSATVVTELDPNEVTLSRAGFVGRAAWRVRLLNGAANVLNNASFTAETVVVEAATEAVVAGAVAAIDAAVGVPGVTDVIAVSGSGENCRVVVGQPTKLDCNFTDNQIGIGEGFEFIIVAKTPTLGGRLKLNWTFGGDEGRGGTIGCCTLAAQTPYTLLIDAAAANSTVKTHVQSFMVKNVLNAVFTGISAGAATEEDPWSTVAELGTGYVVNAVNQTYTKATVDELETSATLGSCSPLNKNQCWLSRITIPDTRWVDANDPLRITLERHSSIIKNGSKLSNYVIQYSTTPSVLASFSAVPYCSATVLPLLGQPCIESCVEIALTSKPSPYVWRCTVKALDNGGYRSE